MRISAKTAAIVTTPPVVGATGGYFIYETYKGDKLNPEDNNPKREEEQDPLKPAPISPDVPKTPDPTLVTKTIRQKFEELGFTVAENFPTLSKNYFENKDRETFLNGRYSTQDQVKTALEKECPQQLEKLFLGDSDSDFIHAKRWCRNYEKIPWLLTKVEKDEELNEILTSKSQEIKTKLGIENPTKEDLKAKCDDLFKAESFNADYEDKKSLARQFCVKS